MVLWRDSLIPFRRYAYFQRFSLTRAHVSLSVPFGDLSFGVDGL